MQQSMVCGAGQENVDGIAAFNYNSNGTKRQDVFFQGYLEFYP